MRTPRTPLSLCYVLSALWLTACDGGHEDHTICDEAGCDSADARDGASQSDSESDVDMSSPDGPSQAEGDAGSANPGVDAASTTPDVDASVAEDVDGHVAQPEADAASADAGVDGSTLDASTTPDANVTTDASTSNNDAGGGSTFVPVRFSTTDHGASAFFSADRLSVENRGEDRGNARSDAFIAPGSGVFYFEAQRQIDTVGFYGVGIATASASLTGELGATSDSLGLFTQGSFADASATCAGSAGFQSPEMKRDYGFVIDYRSANPRVLFVLDDGNSGVEIRRTCTIATSAPIYIFYSGARWEVGYQIRINTGSDTVNLPFHFSASQVKAALNAASESQVSAAIVFGFGKTRALPLSADPVLSAPADRAVSAGSNVTLTGTASDAEDGNLTASIRWIDISSQHHAPVVGSGGSFSFVAALGRHPVIMSITDSVGRTVTHTVMVTATGTLPQPSSVRLVSAPEDPLASGPPESIVSSDGLSVDLHATTKKGVRCNQPIYGEYWYFEAHRNGAPANEGVGLVIPDGNLNPYDFVNVPWSMSINLTGSAWYNLNSISGWDPANNHYGFAVDYRDQHPKVHIIIGNALGGVLHRTIDMKDVWGPIHPMVYGNPSYDPPGSDPGNDITVNFGHDPAKTFVFDPPTILGTLADGIEMHWGNQMP